MKTNIEGDGQVRADHRWARDKAQLAARRQGPDSHRSERRETKTGYAR
ncbi:MAG: hypothetical protein Q8P22_13080 [Chloroflexota bacterium]|nr:hypothetical protein [Chloroflexota bacterium]